MKNDEWNTKKKYTEWRMSLLKHIEMCIILPDYPAIAHRAIAKKKEKNSIEFFGVFCVFFDGARMTTPKISASGRAHIFHSIKTHSTQWITAVAIGNRVVNKHRKTSSGFRQIRTKDRFNDIKLHAHEMHMLIVLCISSTSCHATESCSSGKIHRKSSNFTT